MSVEVREPTADNKKLMESKGLNSSRWLVVWEDKEVLEIISKRTKQRRILEKI